LRGAFSYLIAELGFTGVAMNLLSILLCVLFVGLKLTNYIAWSWVWVLSPLWIGFIFTFLIIFVALVKKESKKVRFVRK